MAYLLMKKLFENYPGSRINFNLSMDSQLDRINIQTKLMGKVFMYFPDVLLLIRSHNAMGKVLYTFIADGPRLNCESAFLRIVHMAYPTNESPASMSEMFHFLKEFNPCWPQIRIFLVDPFFKGVDCLAKAFPSAEVVLSSFHVCTYFKQNISKLSLPANIEDVLINNLTNIVCSATTENLQDMYTNLLQYVKPDLLFQLNPDWLLMDQIWALHRWRNGKESSTYIEMMNTLVEEIGQTFSNSLPWEDKIFALISFIQTEIIDKNIPSLGIQTPQEMAVFLDKEEPSTSESKTDICHTKSDMDSETSLMICQSLNDICVPAAADLCSKEFFVAQTSLQFMTKNEDSASIRLLENPQMVNWENQKSCTCPFYKTMKLPCRHILALLKANQEILKPEMLDPAWQKSTNAHESMFPVPMDTLKIIKGDTKDLSPDQVCRNSLTDQITKVLSECSDEEFQQRYNTLRELADAWIGPYEQVKL
ncbi:zinc finger SWIM domain-containing 1 [Pelobates cultripes]|uniref:Zinc finger SWIM domain-containing 1 n=1 Tax=Pelobates cultripes TaxID=61616 RepID=A0AAD1SIV3_PELCU|nr:zinc finger SWIM domain-containing 1 [Pelobates cultripes]